MNKIGKKIAIGAIATSLTMGISVGANAYNANTAEEQAEALKTLSLFQGSDKGFELDRGLTRMEALIMAVRLSGNEHEALNSETSHPFTDAPTWENAEKYVGFAYENGIITGVTDTTLDPNSPVTAQMYATLVLRALGYTDGEIAVWDNWEELAKTAGIYTDDLADDVFLRGDMVEVSYLAVEATDLDTGLALSETLMDEGVFGELSYAVAMASSAKVTPESDLVDIAGKAYEGQNSDMLKGLAITPLSEENMQYYLGTSELEIEEGIGIEPMFSAVAHSVVILRLAEGEDIEEAKATIQASVDPRKWICVGVEPENVKVSNIDNLLILVMDNESSDEITENFLSITKATADENGMIMLDDMYLQEGKTVNVEYVTDFSDKLNSLKDTYFAENETFYATVPNKSYYAKDLVASYTDHDEITSILAENLTNFTAIDLSETLALDEFYNTDPHWEQENIIDTAEAIGAALGFAVGEFTETEYSDFVGSYGRNVEDIAGETVTILTNSAIENAVVTNTQNPEFTAVYEMDKLQSENPYDVFLSGATPLTVIENPNASGVRELVIFRDSYASSIAPLMIDSYSKITLVDLRYMASSLLPEHVNFENAEVLFLFSDDFVNNMMLMK